MTKAKVEKKLVRRIKAIRKIWLKYLDSLDDKGNEVEKENGYLNICIFRECTWFNSYVDRKEFKEENQVDIIIHFSGEKHEVANCEKRR